MEKQGVADVLKDYKIELAAAIILLSVMYFPTFRWLYKRWAEPGSNYGYILMVPPVVVFLFWRMKTQLIGIRPAASRLGLWMLIPGTLLHIAARYLNINFISGLSLPVTLMGSILYLFGKKMARRCLFPVLYLFFMVPIPVITIRELNLKLKLFTAHWSAVTMSGLGIDVVEEGSFLHFPTGTLVVGNICSGLKYLIALIAFGALYAYIVENSGLKRWVLFAASFPIAIAANIVRIVALGLIANRWGIEASDGAAHYLAGVFIFAVALTLLSALRGAMERFWPGSPRLT
ncbi:exosortase/archaeosortase family protein [Candidatus Omnitrophota bacterium]